MKYKIIIGMILGMLLCISIPINRIEAYYLNNDACEIYASILGKDVLKNIGFDIGIWTKNNDDFPVEVTFTFSEVTCRWWEHVTFNYSAPPGEHRVTFDPGCVNGFFQMQVFYQGNMYERRGLITSGIIILRPVINLDIFEGDHL